MSKMFVKSYNTVGNNKIRGKLLNMLGVVLYTLVFVITFVKKQRL
jgi:hypothetical protein